MYSSALIDILTLQQLQDINKYIKSQLSIQTNLGFTAQRYPLIPREDRETLQLTKYIYFQQVFRITNPAKKLLLHRICQATILAAINVNF